jgi:hypothetical protein
MFAESEDVVEVEPNKGEGIKGLRRACDGGR